VKTRAWKAILSAWADVDARIAQDLPSGSGELDEGDFEVMLADLRLALTQRLAQLSLELREIEIARLRADLTENGAASSPQDQARLDEALKREADAEIQQIFAPITIHIDERVLLLLPPTRSTSWSRLQGDVIQSDDGGAVFYDYLDNLLAQSRAPQLVLEVYSFCLSEGFFGRYIEAPERIQAYREEIARRIPTPVVTKTTNESRAPARTKVMPPYVYYGIAALIVILIILLARALMPTSHPYSGSSHAAGARPEIRS